MPLFRRLTGTTEDSFQIGKGGGLFRRIVGTARLRLPNLLRWLPGGAAVGGHLVSDGSGDLGVTRDNLAATADPTVSNDNTQGYGIGSLWVRTSTHRIYVCVDAATGAAVWKVLDFGERTIWQDCRSVFDATAPYKSKANATPEVALKMQFPGTNDVGTPTLVETMVQAGNTNVTGVVSLVDVTTPASPSTIATGTFSFGALAADQDYIFSVPVVGTWPTGHAILELQFYRTAGTAAFRLSEISIEQNV